MPSHGQGPSFAARFRCERLGWHWLDSRRMWLRISPQGPHSFRIEAAPTGEVPPHEALNGEALVWWRAPAAAVEAMLAECAPLRGLVAPTSYQSWVVDEVGKEVAS